MTIIHRCAKDSFGLGWDEEMVKGFRERGHITLDMFLKAKEATKPEVGHGPGTTDPVYHWSLPFLC